jgi:unsaturated rhamnogalacturonyl hydrolase
MKRILVLAFAAATSQLAAQSLGKEKLVLLDYYFNNEWKKDSAGVNTRYHYTWEDKTSSGFSILKTIFNRNGAQTKHLETRPTKKSLKNAAVYLIVDPDTEKETRYPHFMTAAHAAVIAKWVKKGGVLLLLGNDAGNAELKNFNLLASKFGIGFNEDNFNRVMNNQYEQGDIVVPEGHFIFKSAKKLFVKELATLRVSTPATTVLTKDGKNIMAVAKYGKGTVFALGDPWLYNEYTNGRLPSDFDNYKAAEDFVKWVMSQVN